MDALKKRMIIWITLYQTTTHPKWVFFHNLFLKSSLVLNVQAGIQVHTPNQQTRPLPSLLSDSYSKIKLSNFVQVTNEESSFVVSLPGSARTSRQCRSTLPSTLLEIKSFTKYSSNDKIRVVDFHRLTSDVTICIF